MPIHIIAHRGYSHQAPENTNVAFDLALESGFPHVELDVHLTGDGIPVVIHDKTVDRTTDGFGNVIDTTLDGIRALDIVAPNVSSMGRLYEGLSVPTLEEVLLRYRGKAHLYIELKSDHTNLPKYVAKLLNKHGWLDVHDRDIYSVPGVTIISFNLEQVIRSRAIIPEVGHGWLVLRLGGTEVEVALRHGLRALFPHLTALTSHGVEAARLAGISVVAWGLGTLADLRRADSTGVCGVIVDWPGAALEFIQQNKLG